MAIGWVCFLVYCTMCQSAWYPFCVKIYLEMYRIVQIMLAVKYLESTCTVPRKVYYAGKKM